MRRRSLFQSATTKLTLSYVAFVMLISISFSGVLYHAATVELSRGLQRESDRISESFPVLSGDSMIDRVEDDYRDGAQHILFQLLALNALVLIATAYGGYRLAQRTLEPIEQAHEQQKRFTADVSHELRTPLTALKMEAEVGLLNTKASAKELRTIITSNLEEASKIEILINNLLRLTRLENDELQQDFKAVPVQDLLREALQQTSQFAASRNVTITAPTNVTSTVHGDQTSLVQLLVILLDNATKYSPANSEVVITVRTERDRCLISIKDQGKGIAAKDLAYVFDRFYRADNSRAKHHSQGFGLGLSIAKMIADLHDADITLQRNSDAGITAIVSLPIAPKLDK